MRVATISRSTAALEALQRRQSEMSQAQLQMTGGLRVNRPSDDPTAAGRAERARIVQSRNESEQRALGASRNAMTLAESSLGQADGLMQSARETLLAAGNGTYSAAERKSLAVQLTQLRSQLLAVANQGDGGGGYIFGGQGTHSSPFLDGIGGVAFSGTGGQINGSGSEQMPTTVDGRQIWLGARSGNGVFETDADPANTGAGWINAGSVADPAALTGSSYEVVFAAGPSFSVLKDGLPTALVGVAYRSGLSVAVDGMSFAVTGQPAAGDRFSLVPSTPDLDPFKALDKAIAVMNNPNANVGQVAQAVALGVRDTDAVLSQLQNARSVAGATLNRLDSIEQRNADKTLWARQVQSDAEDLDMVQAVSDFQNKQTGYQAALQTYSIVQRMSLFDYLR